MAVGKIVDLTLAAVTANNLNSLVLRCSLVNPVWFELKIEFNSNAFGKTEE